MDDSLFQALGSWGRAKTSEEKTGRTKARRGERACKNFFNDPLGIAGAAIPSDWSILTVLSTLRRILSIGKMASAACVSDFEESTMSNKSSSWERRFRYSFNRFWEKFNFSALSTTC